MFMRQSALAQNPDAAEARPPVEPAPSLGARPRTRARTTARRRTVVGELRTDLPLVVLDCVLVACAYVVALVLRFEGHVPGEYWSRLGPVLALAILCYVTLHTGLGLYGRVWLQAGAAEAWWLVVASATATSVIGVLDLVPPGQRLLPLSVVLNAGVLALLLLAGVRFQSRIRAHRGYAATSGSGVLLVGPVRTARNVVEQMRQDPSAGLDPVAILTDEPDTWSRRLAGVPVLGPIADLERVASAHGATQVLLLPGALSGPQVRTIAELAQDAGLWSRSLPTLHESMDHGTRLRDIRNLSLEDLLGRDQVDVDDAAVRAIVQGQRVLVTGAGGSIGSEIAAQVSRLGPSLLVLLDHDETHLHDAVARLDAPSRSVLGDIRDEAFVERLMMQTRPEVIFHAAAHKHVPILEDHPSEAVRTNVHGTEVLVRAATHAGTKRFVAISTDKAVDPRSVMGATKRLAEQLVVHADGPGRHYCAVRFGNVLGSRGSVVPTFLRQVETGGPVTVTHPDMTRFFMTTREAVSLVMQAAATAVGGEVFMLDMGEPVRIVDLAERIIGMAGLQSGRDIAVEFTGLRPGEKLTEQLSSDHESVHATTHAKIARVGSSLCDRRLLLDGVAELNRRAWEGSEDATKRLLFELARMPGEIALDCEAIGMAEAVIGHDETASLAVSS
jgi:FlaA1/EpsC-like NDP-sugar epimerase